MFKVSVLGTSAAVPTDVRWPSAQVVTYNERHYLVDCGEGTQMQLIRYRIKTSRLDAIFISHLHGDHVFGLPGLLTSMSVYGRNFPLKIYGPPALKTYLDTIFEQTQAYLTYDLEFVPLGDFSAGDQIFEAKQLKVKLLPLEHRIFTRGFHFSEANKRPKFNFYKAKELGVPNIYFSLLKQGNPITLKDGRTIQPEQVLFPPEDPLSFAYCSDTKFHEPLIEHISGTTLLYHETTFLDNMRSRAYSTSHSTAKDAATIASRAAVKALMIGHYSARYKSSTELVEEARLIFPQTFAAEEGSIYKVADYV